MKAYVIRVKNHKYVGVGVEVNTVPLNQALLFATKKEAVVNLYPGFGEIVVPVEIKLIKRIKYV